MSSTIPWFDPVNHQWHVFNDDGSGMATGDPVKSFLTVDEALAYIKGGNQDIIEESQTLDENNAEGAASGDKKQVKRGKTYEEYARGRSTSIRYSTIKGLQDPKFTWEGTVLPKEVDPYEDLAEALVTDFDATEKLKQNGGSRLSYSRRYR